MDLLAGIGTGVYYIVGAVLLVVVLFAFVWASRYQKVGPNEVLIISGIRRRRPDGTAVGYRIVHGGGSFVWPVLEQAQVLSLELMTLDVQTPEVYTVHGVPVIVDGVAQIKVKSDDVSIGTAAEQFLSKSQSEIMRIALQTVEGHLRAILGTMTVEDIYKNREAFAQKVQENAAPDLSNMGLQIVSFTIKDIKDRQGYLEALGKPRIAEVKRDAIVGEAEAQRDATIRSAAASQAGEIAKIEAKTRIAQSQRDYEIKAASFQADINTQKAQMELAYDLQSHKTNQLVKKEEMQVQMVEKEMAIQIQEKEIIRKEKELDATVRKPAEAEKLRTQLMADAEQYKLVQIAQGQADGRKLLGLAEAEAEKARGMAAAEVEKARGMAAAEVAKAQGLAQAEIVRAMGLSEAEAMEKKALAWAKYNQAAVTQMFIDKLPEIASAISAPLAKTEKIIVINSDGDSAGANKITKDVINILGQLPPVIESLSGIDLHKLVSNLPGGALKSDGNKA